MIDGLRSYPEMKPSGLAWLDDVPAHWDVRRIKTLLSEVDNRTRTGTERLLSLRMRQGLVDHIDAGGKLIPPESLVNFKIVEPGQVVMNRMRAAAGLFGVASVRGLVSPDYAVFEPKPEAFNPYLLQAFRLPSLSAVFRAESKGLGTGESGFLRLYTDRFGPIPVPYPPLDEQRLIVRFLDRHGAQTAKLIRAKKKIIALLNEQKQAIIHRAVTRGLDPNVKLKPSGVSWLGDVPEGWDVAALRHRYDQCLGKMLDTKRITGAYLVPYLRNTDVQWEGINVINLPLMDVPPDEYARYCVRLGDLLVCEGGEIGRAAIWSNALELCAFQKALHRLRPRNLKRDNPQFLLLQLRLAVALGAFVDGHESTIAHLTGEKLRAHRFVFPSLVEQQRIISHIETQSLEINAAADRVEREIALIQEFRTRLIADVVTGKLDVRAAAASLPEVAELEATDDLAEGDDLDEVIDDAESEEVAA
ncbi:restriction endonuclease subunit S [Bradyrhizobium commune]|uniref:Restriction endonuclease subunit S n=1 Tax=Bradyrhizobium commune TaxID=83627 RepID=A0A7S9H0W2_9BRAD|nr:restriction endonuclease subunit S [Bradyrhizobium commune]QPF92125.1 restriction endonuclease subunit S [Bradyrhizobium commune]